MIPFELAKPVPSNSLSSPDPLIPISFSTIFYQSTPEAAEALKWALQQGRPVDIDLPNASTDGVLEGLQDLLAKATADLIQIPAIVISEFVKQPQG